MAQKTDITIISVYGRGNWLAAELAEKGKQVSLVDLSPSFGHWAPEDWEGPFGFFQTDKIKASQLERLAEEDYMQSVDQGFVLWLKQGPIEFKSFLTSFWIQGLGLHKKTLDYISQFDSYSDEKIKRKQTAFLEIPFEQSWLVHLAHQMSSSRYMSNATSVEMGRPLKITSPFKIRRVTRPGAEKSLAWCEQKGVRVYRDAKIKDLQIQSQFVENLEIESAWSGILSSSQFVWGLTSEETKRCNLDVFQQLFRGKQIAPTWVWVRYRVGIQSSEAAKILPIASFIIEDLALPWTHTNFMAFQQTVSENIYDVWVRIPAQHRFQRNYLKQIGEGIIRILDRRIPESFPEIVDMPQDFHYGEKDLGPSRFPVFDIDELNKMSRSRQINLFFDGPECWSSLDWGGIFEYQNQLFGTLMENK